MSKEIEALWENMQSRIASNISTIEYTTIKQALHRLEAIDNAEPSEALKFVEEWKYQINSYIDCSLDCGDIDNECYNHLMDELEQYYTTIKQALLKAQEPKKYLKWEDLEFDNNASVKKHLKVKLGGNIYKAYYHFCFLLNSELFCIENANENLNIYITNKQFFNDLHLERVKE